jgi:signal transduction histidine kinase
MTTAVAPTRTRSERAVSHTITYRYRSGRVTVGTFLFLVGAAFLIDGAGLLHLGASAFWPLFLIALGIGMLLRRARRLQVEEDRTAQLAVAEERVRIARELHDIVAHGVSLMTIQIAAARRVADSKREAAEQSLLAAEQTGRQTLNELDSMLGVLRGADASIGAAAAPGALDVAPAVAGAERSGNGHPSRDGPLRRPLPRLADIPALVSNLQTAGRAVTLQVLGDPPTVPASVELTMYRVVQEALTNAARYAADASIDVQVIYAPEAITVFVDDDGPGGDAVGRAGGGHGLVGMSERLATFGGSLQAGPRQPGPGWRVYATIPVLAIAA